MSAADEELDGIDLPRETSSDDFPNAQINKQRQPQDSEDDIASLHSDDFVPEASSSSDSGYQPLPMGSQNPEALQGNNRRVIPDMTTNPFAEEATYFTRPNRYFGPDSTWLSWTKEDRLVAQTLDRLRSQNLSIHLFNAYALKRHGQANIRQNPRDRKGKGCARSLEGGIDSDGERKPGIIPPRTWTAWPLAPNQVPRENEVSDLDDYETHRTVPDLRPSAILEDCVIATATRLAREQWRGRRWAPESKIPARSSSKQGVKVEPGTDVEIDESQQTTARPDGEDVHSPSRESDSGSEVFESQPWGGDDQPASQPQFVGSNSEAESSDAESERRPTPIADEDAVRSVLLPSTRHILSKVDDLLMGLHHARQAYTTTRPHASKSQKEEGSEASVSAESEQSNIDTRRKRKRKRPSSGPTTRSDHPSKHPRQSKDPLGLRDWSDIVGMAALTGWDPTVVRRASERCANLFGENMMFRTFFEGDPVRKEKLHFTEHYAVDGETFDSEAEVSDEDRKMILVRTSRACKTCARLKETCEPVDGSAEGNGPCKRCLTYDEVETCSGIRTILRPQPNTSKPRNLRCPHANCNRHNIPFQKRHHLQRHIDAVHRSSQPPCPTLSAPSGPASSGGEYLSAPASEIVCPIQTCPRHEKGFSRGHRLYQHIIKMHPEVDVKEVKRLEKTRRGDKRGRWRDERRRTPRSRSRSMRPREETEADGSASDD